MLSALERRILFKKIGFDVAELPDAIAFEQLKPLLVYGVQSQLSEALTEQFIDDVNSERIPAIKSGLEQWEEIYNNPPDEWGGPCPLPLDSCKPEPTILTNKEICLYESGVAPNNVVVPRGRATLIKWDGSKQAIKQARQFGYDSKIHLTVTVTYQFTRQAVANWFIYIEADPNEAIALWFHPLSASKQAPSEPLQSPLEGSADENNGKQTRESQLHALIWRARVHVYSASKGSAQKVWLELQNRYKQHDTDKIIQEVTATEISWRSAYGNEPTFKRTSLDALLTRLKKSPPF